MSSLTTDRLTVAYPSADSGTDFDFRVAALRFGHRLGWASILAVSAAIALDGGVRHRGLLVGLVLVVVAGNAVAMAVPWNEWLAMRRGRIVLDLWCGGLVAFVALLVVRGGSSFALLLFLTVPFIAVVQAGRRRRLWLAASAATCTAATIFAPLAPGATAMRLALVGTAVFVALVLTRRLQREADARARAGEQAELAEVLAREASHRAKNDLQTAADLLLLGRPAGPEGAAFDETAARIRSIAAVHRLLIDGRDRVDAADLLRRVTTGVPVPVSVEADPVPLDPATAKTLALVANELVMNAYRHGALPIVIEFSTGSESRLRVDDRGAAGDAGDDGLGLELVRTLVEHGLHGSFALHRRANGGTRAEVVFREVVS